ncbi:uncharacterized protein LOC133906807 [Phragmites australis]|uniref:uncharacterized protein LOC133906807 n=1 Tax=Phragmites australis TaxID=29695 RepID=UPI002D77FF47|nr:uncharacterized protein LOC133906807 [Phragmites australis]
MSQILFRRIASHSYGIRDSGCCRRLASAGGHHYYGGGERRRAPPQDDESRAVRVSVWWDFENCHLPNGINVLRVAPRVAAALRAAGIRGPLSITAFGDVLQLARSSQEALAATGVSISHVPRNGKNSSDRSFMADLVYWIAQNPPPVHFFLISGDRDFANILHRLRMSNYNILLACPSSATSVLCSAATIMWPWEALVKGEDFSPKHFNHPPDGLSGSWYGHCKGALDDLFVETESEEPIKVPSDSKHCPIPSDSKHCSIPKYVTNAILEALHSYPKGVSLSELRGELKKNNIFLGTDFFGHKKFSCLLQSMPDIVEFLDPPPGENQPYVTAVNNRLLQPGEQSSKIQSSAQCNVKENNLTRTEHNDKTHPSFMSEQDSKPLSSSQSIDGNRSFTETVNENPPTFAVSSSPSDVLSKDQKEYPTADVNARTESPANHREVDERTNPGTPSSSGMENSVNKDGLFKRIWMLWNGSENAKYEVSQNSESTSAEVVDDLQTPPQECNADHRRKLLKRIHKNGRSDGSDSTAAVSFNLSSLSDDGRSENIKRDPSILENSEPSSGPASLPMGKAGKKDDTSDMNKGLFSWTSRWWTFGKSDADNITTNINAIDEARTDSIEESESSNASTYGSGEQVVNEIFTKSYFWDILEQQLSKPLGSELVSKAKTREELVHGLQKLGCWPLKGLCENDLHQLVHLLVSEKKWIEETPPRHFPFRLTLLHKRTCVPSNSSKYNGLSSIFSNGKSSQQGKHVNDNSRTSRPLTREEILSDCHKLLKELLSQYEYGFNISIFKLRFAQKHGYELDHQKLGYPDLESLLQIMPDARIKFPRVLRAENGNGQAGSKRNGIQTNGDDFIWEELGPVSATTETTAGNDKETCYCPPTPSDDEFSDNDNQSDQQTRRDAEQSSLLQIIDSWNSSKDGGSSKEPQDIDKLVDCSRSAHRPTRLSHKQYSFVSDSEADKEKDKLVESVLGSLQKAQGSKVHS